MRMYAYNEEKLKNTDLLSHQSDCSGIKLKLNSTCINQNKVCTSDMCQLMEHAQSVNTCSYRLL